MPYKDPVKRAAYHAAYSKRWDAAHPGKRQGYKEKYRREKGGYVCHKCKGEHKDRRYKCPHCGFTSQQGRTHPPSKYLSKHHITYRLLRCDYERMLAKQQHACAICKRAVKLVVDHCHTTGKIRGLLCQRCNHMIGHGADDPLRLEAGAIYLRVTK